MEIKWKRRPLQNHTLPLVRDSGKPYRRNIGMTSRSIAGVSADFNANERSRAYLAYIAKVEIHRAQALAEAYRLSLR